MPLAFALSATVTQLSKREQCLGSCKASSCAPKVVPAVISTPHLQSPITRSSLTKVQKSTSQQSAPWPRDWPRWAFLRQQTSRDTSAASYTQRFQTPQSVKGWESDRVVSVVSMWLPLVRAIWGEQCGTSAASSPHAVVVMLHRSRGGNHL